MVTQRDIGPAHTGLSDWYWQRLSAVVLIFTIPWPFVLLVQLVNGDMTQLDLLDRLDNPASRMTHTVLILALLLHAYLGIKLIVEDYLHHVALRLPVLALMMVAMFCMGFWWLTMIWAWAG